MTTETGTHGSRTENMEGASDSTGPPTGQLVGRPAVVQRQALMVLTVPVLVLTAVAVDLQRLCLVLSGSVFWQAVGRKQRCLYVHVERLSGRRAQRDELHGRHDVFPSPDDRVKALALSRGVGTGIAEDWFTSSISLTVNAFPGFCNVHG